MIESAHWMYFHPRGDLSLSDPISPDGHKRKDLKQSENWNASAHSYIKNKPAPDEKWARENSVNEEWPLLCTQFVFTNESESVHITNQTFLKNLEVLRASNITLQFAILMQMKEKDARAGKRPQWAEACCQAWNPGSTPQYPYGEGEKRLPQIALWPPQACWGMYLPTSLPATQPTYTHTYKQAVKVF